MSGRGAQKEEELLHDEKAWRERSKSGNEVCTGEANLPVLPRTACRGGGVERTVYLP